MAVVLAGTAGAGQGDSGVWWRPKAELVIPSAERPLPIEPVEGTLPTTSLRLLRLVDHPSRVRPYVIALREFGLLRGMHRTAEMSVGTIATPSIPMYGGRAAMLAAWPVQVTASPAIIAGNRSESGTAAGAGSR